MRRGTTSRRRNSRIAGSGKARLRRRCSRRRRLRANHSGCRRNRTADLRRDGIRSSRVRTNEGKYAHRYRRPRSHWHLPSVTAAACHRCYSDMSRGARRWWPNNALHARSRGSRATRNCSRRSPPGRHFIQEVGCTGKCTRQCFARQAPAAPSTPTSSPATAATATGPGVVARGGGGRIPPAAPRGGAVEGRRAAAASGTTSAAQESARSVICKARARTANRTAVAASHRSYCHRTCSRGARWRRPHTPRRATRRSR